MNSQTQQQSSGSAQDFLSKLLDSVTEGNVNMSTNSKHSCDSNKTVNDFFKNSPPETVPECIQYFNSMASVFDESNTKQQSLKPKVGIDQNLDNMLNSVLNEYQNSQPNLFGNVPINKPTGTKQMNSLFPSMCDNLYNPKSQCPVMNMLCPSTSSPMFCVKVTFNNNLSQNPDPNSVKIKLAAKTCATPCILTDAQPLQGLGTVMFVDEITTNFDFGFRFTRDTMPNTAFTLGKLGTPVQRVNAKVSVSPNTCYLPKTDTTGVYLYTGSKSQEFYLETGTRVSIPAGVPFYIGEEEETFTKDTVVTLL